MAEVVTDLYTRIEFARLFDRCDLQYDEAGSSAKAALVHETLRRAQTQASRAEQRALRGLLDFIRIVVEQKYSRIPAQQLSALRDALFADGYELLVTVETSLLPAANAVVAVQILPTDLSVVPLGHEITSLEAELNRRGYTVAVTHYQQAVASLTDHRYEASNGQLRSMLEELVIRVAEKHTGYVDTGRASQGGRAVSHMLANGLPAEDVGNALKGVWELSHTRGSHPGRSDADEARIRMSLLTSVARLLLNHFPA